MRVQQILTIALGILLLVTISTFVLTLTLVTNIYANTSIERDLFLFDQKMLEISNLQEDLHIKAVKDPQFYNATSDIYSEQILSEIAILLEAIQTLDERQPFFAQKYDRDLYRLQESLLAYQLDTENFIASLKQLGFKNWGQIGEMRTSVHAIERSLDEQNLYVYDYGQTKSISPSTLSDLERSQLQVVLLQARRAEKDFLLRHEESYVQKHRDLHLTFLSLLNSTDVDKEAAQEIESVWTQYHEDFLQVAQTSQGIFSVGGLLDQHDARFDAVSKTMLSILYAVESDIFGTSRQIIFIISLYAAIVILVQILVIVIIMRSIGFPLRHLITQIRSLKDITDVSEIDAPKNNDLGILADEYNILIKKIKAQENEMLTKEEEKRVQLAKVNAQLSEKVDETYTMQVKAIEDYFKNPEKYDKLVKKIKRKNG